MYLLVRGELHDEDGGADPVPGPPTGFARERGRLAGWPAANPPEPASLLRDGGRHVAGVVHLAAQTTRWRSLEGLAGQGARPDAAEVGTCDAAPYAV